MPPGIGYDPEQLRRDALMNQMGGPPVMPPQQNATQPVGSGTKLAEPGAPVAPVAAPAAPPRPTNYGVTSGYDPEKFGAGPNSLKYLAGQHLSRYADPSGRIGKSSIEQAMASEAWKNDPYLKNATYSGTDKINFGGTPADLDRGGLGVYDVDVIRNLDDSGFGDALVWQDLVNTGGGGGGAAPMGGGGADLAAILGAGQQAGGGDNLDQIMQQIQALAQGGEDPMQREALMHLLGGGGGLI